LKILPISDVHGSPHVIYHILNEIDPDSYDVLTCSGDVWEGTSTNGKYKWSNLQEIIKKPIIMIQGNHDYWPTEVFDEYPDIHMLHNETVEIDGVKFFGTPHTVNFMDWNHMRDEQSLFDMWDLVVPKDLDVMLSHGPPYGYGDNCNMPVYGNTAESKLGSKALLAILEERAPKYVFCGHIHTGDRVTIMDNGTKIYNVSCLDEAYQFMGHNPEPEVIELEL
jgi:Icc-related predicted phosphoesterase